MYTRICVCCLLHCILRCCNVLLFKWNIILSCLYTRADNNVIVYSNYYNFLCCVWVHGCKWLYFALLWQNIAPSIGLCKYEVCTHIYIRIRRVYKIFSVKYYFLFIIRNPFHYKKFDFYLQYIWTFSWSDGFFYHIECCEKRNLYMYMRPSKVSITIF